MNYAGRPRRKGQYSGRSWHKKLYMYMCPILNGFRDTAISLHISKTVDKKEILLVRPVANTVIYFSSDKVGTVYLV
jgi:hypothetical protein